MRWRDFLRQRIPALTTLMARMNFAPAERNKVLFQILRLFTTMRLAPEKMELIIRFLERHLALTAKETVAFEQAVE